MKRSEQTDRVKTMEQNNYAEKTENLIVLASALMPKLPYHNAQHAVEVYAAASMYARFERVTPQERFLLCSAAALHDIIYVRGAKDNEERSAEFACRYLPTLEYTVAEANTVARLIRATKLPTNPQEKLEAILCDADVDNLGRDDFFEKGEALRKELDIPESKEWYLHQLSFLESHAYYTPAAKQLRNDGKRRNIRKLQRMIEEYGQKKQLSSVPHPV